jgi:hypothetical protein
VPPAHDAPASFDCSAFSPSPKQQLPEASAIFTKRLAACSPRTAAARVAGAKAAACGMEFADGNETRRRHEYFDEPSDRERAGLCRVVERPAWEDPR